MLLNEFTNDYWSNEVSNLRAQISCKQYMKYKYDNITLT